MSSAESSQVDELTVTFQPPLYLERRGWVFEIIRREHVRIVLDVGCGEGELLSCLSNPAPWLSPPPLSLLATMFTSDSSTTLSATIATELSTSTEELLHPVKVMGLDTCARDLQDAIEGTDPNLDMSWKQPSRWEPLEVQIWEGGLETFNPEFVGVECILSTEVIEHLPEPVLQAFAPVLLGAYHPRLLLLTTPSYTFNARFTAPSAPPGARSGFRDPTGRTARIFRHHDHRFEWTVAEFADWCARVADAWGYDVEVGGVGRPRERDPYGRDEELGYASQVAAFRRREGTEWAARRLEAYERFAQGRCSEGLKSTGHKLLAAHRHAADEKAGRPAPLREIGEELARRMGEYGERTMQVRELWFDDGVAALCGGWIEVLLAAVEAYQDLHLHRSPSEASSDWKVEFDKIEIKNNGGDRMLWPEQEADEGADGSLSSSASWPETPELGWDIAGTCWDIASDDSTRLDVVYQNGKFEELTVDPPQESQGGAPEWNNGWGA
ncbi:hypothetical protein WOLCODRAFT_72633 [Wolfiporia cocos MD-104 SS10]|uniref:Small RNA 2'-O-methyltransferase n=1 Tax=Wolfiporia cocos (strain MD-104) TaxID=742152 RepID=A0A2H3JJY7_WOLCO|nr:hypothetical protein WOLCODRAFT_72633 [Wolfiporia cocos MD-104 SS10]